jgi:hypothetical protein
MGEEDAGGEGQSAAVGRLALHKAVDGKRVPHKYVPAKRMNDFSKQLTTDRRYKYLKALIEPKTVKDDLYLAGLIDATGSFLITRKSKTTQALVTVTYCIQHEKRRKMITGQWLFALLQRTLPYMRKRKKLALLAFEMLSMSPYSESSEYYDKAFQIVAANRSQLRNQDLLARLMWLKKEAQSRERKRDETKDLPPAPDHLPAQLRSFLSRTLNSRPGQPSEAPGDNPPP